MVADSGQALRVARIVTFDGDVPAAQAGDAITLVFDAQSDVARGDLLTSRGAPPLSARSFLATVVVLQPEGLRHSSEILLKAAGRTTRVTLDVEEVYQLSSGSWAPALELPVNAIGRVRLHFPTPFHFDRFSQCRETGAFILISRKSNTTLAGGMILDAAAGDGPGEQRLRLSLPKDLADLLLAHPQAVARRDEIVMLDEG